MRSAQSASSIPQSSRRSREISTSTTSKSANLLANCARLSKRSVHSVIEYPWSSSLGVSFRMSVSTVPTNKIFGTIVSSIRKVYVALLRAKWWKDPLYEVLPGLHKAGSNTTVDEVGNSRRLRLRDV